jgi:hypothetical protein
VQKAPVVNDQDVTPAPFVGVSGAESQPLLDKPERGSTALVDGFEATRVIPKEGAFGRKKRRVKGSATSSHEDRSIFENMKLLWRKAEVLPIEQ